VETKGKERKGQEGRGVMPHLSKQMYAVYHSLLVTMVQKIIEIDQ